MPDIDLNGLEVKNDEAAKRFEVRVNGQTAFISYRRLNGAIIFDHTEVPGELEGHGVGGKLAKAALEHARSSRLRVVPLCPFVANYIRKHPEYHDLLAPVTLKRLLET